MLCCKQQKPKQKRKLHKVYTPQFFATPLNRPFLACFRYLCSFGGGGQQHQQQQPLRIFDDVIHLMNTSVSNKSNENNHRRCCFAKRAKNNQNQPQCLTIEKEVKKYGSFQPGTSFSARPTVLLRAFVPSTGFSIVFRAMLDSGATFSRMAGSLAEVLFANGATCENIWPVGGAENPFQKLISFDYRYISGLKLQSLEDGDEEGREISVGDNNSYHSGCPSISVDANAGPFFTERLPITLVLKKMAQLGLPMTRSGDQLGRTMWNTKTDPK